MRNQSIRTKAIKAIKTAKAFQVRHNAVKQASTTDTANAFKFVGNVATIKRGRKIFAKVYPIGAKFNIELRHHGIAVNADSLKEADAIINAFMQTSKIEEL